MPRRLVSRRLMSGRQVDRSANVHRRQVDRSASVLRRQVDRSANVRSASGPSANVHRWQVSHRQVGVSPLCNADNFYFINMSDKKNL